MSFRVVAAISQDGRAAVAAAATVRRVAACPTTTHPEVRGAQGGAVTLPE
jgi:hypothetical protein